MLAITTKNHVLGYLHKKKSIVKVSFFFTRMKNKTFNLTYVIYCSLCVIKHYLCFFETSAICECYCY